jgi:hypothetical protein
MQSSSCCLFQAGFDPEDGGDMFLPNVSQLLLGLHGIISQEIKLFILETPLKLMVKLYSLL